MIFGKQQKRVRGCAEKLHSDSNDIVVRGDLPLFRKGYIRIGWFLGLSCYFSAQMDERISFLVP